MLANRLRAIHTTLVVCIFICTLRLESLICSYSSNLLSMFVDLVQIFLTVFFISAFRICLICLRPRLSAFLAFFLCSCLSLELIVEKIRGAGFKIEKIKVHRLTLEEAEELYSEHKDKKYFKQLTTFMCKTETVFMVATKPDAIGAFKRLAGDKDPEVAKKKQPGRFTNIHPHFLLQTRILINCVSEACLQFCTKFHVIIIS